MEFITICLAVFGAFCLIVFIGIGIKDAIDDYKMRKKQWVLDEIKKQIKGHEAEFHASTKPVNKD